MPLATQQRPLHNPGRAQWAMLLENLESLTYDLVGNQTRLIKKESSL